MDTILNYLDNVFASLPKTTQLEKIKKELALNMEDKYHELKKQGKTDNEAIGIVISEFGNINEIINELGVKIDDNNKVFVTKDEVYSYQAAKKRTGLLVGIGVLLCILAPVSLMVTVEIMSRLLKNASEDVSGIIGLIPLFVFIAVAVGLFIYSDMSFQKYKYMEKDINLPYTLKDEIAKQYNSYLPFYTFTLITGVVLCILSAIVLIIVSTLLDNIFNLLGVVLLLTMVAIAVFDFIYFGSIKEAYDKLGVTPESKVQKEVSKKAERIISTVASILWPLVTCAYLLLGFLKNWWHPGWMIFVITGILFGAFSSAVTSYYKDK
jgi:low affinity Fe/Cu permease